jgi:hypothetical protein
VVIFAYAIDHVELKTKIQAEQVQRVLEGPQASSGEDTNLELNQGQPGASNQCPCLLFLKLYFMLYLIVH